MIPRTWPQDLIDESLQGFLIRLVKVPLREDIVNFRRYLERAVKNHCIDCYRSRKRRKDKHFDAQFSGWEPESKTTQSPETILQKKERVQRLLSNLEKLEISDRVVLKLTYTPEWITDSEFCWLADRTGNTVATIREKLLCALDMYSRTLIFDPSDDDPNDLIVRRKCMERFRKRRNRAEEKLRSLIPEEDR